MGSVRTGLQIKTERAWTHQLEMEQQEWLKIEKNILELCEQAAEKGRDYESICLDDVDLTIDDIVKYSTENELLIVYVSISTVTVSWKVNRINKIKNFIYLLLYNLFYK